MRHLLARKLTREAFAPFGEVISPQGAHSFKINNGTTTRFHELATAQVRGEDARTILSIFRGEPFAFPVELAMMERHPLGSQAFMPLSAHPYLVAVAPDENGRPGDPHVFLAAPGEGVNYRINTWHHPLISLETVCDFLVVDRAGEGYNLEEFFYDLPFVVTGHEPA